jgi:hypothetical protein
VILDRTQQFWMIIIKVVYAMPMHRVDCSGASLAFWTKLKKITEDLNPRVILFAFHTEEPFMTQQ